MKMKLSWMLALVLILLCACATPKTAENPSQPAAASAVFAGTLAAAPEWMEQEAEIKLVAEPSVLAATLSPEPTAEPTVEPTAEPTPEPTLEPTAEPTHSPTPEPATIAAEVLVNEAGVTGRMYSLGETVVVKAARDGYYVIEAEDGDLLVEQWLVRMESEKSPRAYTAYARPNADIYRDPYLENGRIATLKTNTILTVEDAFGQIVRVTLGDGSEGYALASSISKSKISSGGGSSGNSSGQDGGDIPIGHFGKQEDSVVRLGSRIRSIDKTFTPGIGTILAEDVEGYIVLFDRGDEVRVMEKEKTLCTVLVGEKVGTIPTRLLSLEGDKPYKSWDGYAKSNASFHKHYRMLDEGTKLGQNTRVLVIGEIEGVYIVEMKDQLGYIPAEQVSKTKIVSSGPSDGGWTDPVL